MFKSRIAALLTLTAVAACSNDPAVMNTEPDSGHTTKPDSSTPPANDTGDQHWVDSGPTPTQDTGSGDAAEEEEEEDTRPLVECAEVVEGVNVIDVYGTERRFWVESPTAAAGPVSAVFWFHGFSGSQSAQVDAEQNATLLDNLGITPDANPNFPFVRVLLEDLNLQPFNGLDWDIRTDVPNHDIELFDTVVACLEQHRNVSRDQIFAGGFSAGATILNLLHSVRSDTVRAIYTASGLWINEPANLEAAQRVTIIPQLVDWDWPEPDPVQPSHAAVLLTHGGEGDNVPGTPVKVNLTDAALAATDWLVDRNRLVIECGHTGGHTLHPDVTADVVLDFFAAHIAPGASPWADAAPALPSSCNIHKP